MDGALWARVMAPLGSKQSLAKEKAIVSVWALEAGGPPLVSNPGRIDRAIGEPTPGGIRGLGAPESALESVRNDDRCGSYGST